MEMIDKRKIPGILGGRALHSNISNFLVSEKRLQLQNSNNKGILKFYGKNKILQI
jgi:hypothetical protein